MGRIVLLAGFILMPLFLFGQDTKQLSKLATQYYRSGEYQKASIYYQKLYESSRYNDYYFNKYIDCLLALERFDESTDIIQKQIKKRPKDAQLLVTYGNILERQFKFEEADKQYELAIKKVEGNRGSVLRLANAFVSLTKYELAIRTYEKGIQMMKDENIFAYNLGDLYRRKGDTPKMIQYYLKSLEDNPSRLNQLKSNFQRYLQDDDYLELQTQLYGIVQKVEDNTPFIELLAWVFIQKKDYKNALRQVKLLDRRFSENGSRVYNLAMTASDDKQYDAAVEAFDYIISEKGQASSYYIDAKRESLKCKRKKLVEGFNYTETDLRDLEQQYEIFLNEFGRNKTTATILLEAADLQALYLNDLDKAIILLDELINLPGLSPSVQAEAKLSLGDYYLMKGERWESTLLYSQVDKAFKDDILGHEARFRNAKLSYFMGDFQWAQAQFDVLKASTSKLIANDALDLSIFIMDNLGLDTTSVPLETYADADLLVFQNKFDEAFTKLDQLKKDYPEHSLQDDIFYVKAKIYMKQQKYVKAAGMYQKIIDNYSEEIRADNSLYALAQLYEYQLNDKEKAKELYEKLFLEFSNSTFAVEGRKKYRLLRGDDIQ